MATKGWVPAFAPFARLQREMNEVFDTVCGKQYGLLGRLRPGYVYPPLNVFENDEAYVVECEVPGLGMEDLEVYVTGDRLTVSGRRVDAVPDEQVTLHRREHDRGRFSRALTLGGPVDGSKCEASLADGILSIRIPKAEHARPKRITVQVES